MIISNYSKCSKLVLLGNSCINCRCAGTGKSRKKSQKSGTNSDLRLFYFVHFVYKFLQRTSARCKFLFHHIQFIFSGSTLSSCNIGNLTPTLFLPARFLAPALR
nr:MAG TPA: hypothetical protein [Caudoviricetes sp.]